MPKSLLSDYSAGEIREELLLYETGAGAVATLETIVMNLLCEKNHGRANRSTENIKFLHLSKNCVTWSEKVFE